jgi:hypothetical protein
MPDRLQRIAADRPGRHPAQQGRSSWVLCAASKRCGSGIGPRAPEPVCTRCSRILKAFVDAQWLAEFDARLAAYRAQLLAPRRSDGARAMHDFDTALTVWISACRAWRCSTGARSTSRVWTLRVSMAAMRLLTGDIGSGKSTLVDALTTLLGERPPRGLQQGRRCRRARAFSCAPTCWGTTSPRAMRPGWPCQAGGATRTNSDYAVILAVFHNAGLRPDGDVGPGVLAERPSGASPQRFYAVADKALSLPVTSPTSGPAVPALRTRLRKSGVSLV